MQSSLGSPKKLFFSKKSTVTWWLAGLVITKNGSRPPADCFSRRMRSAKSWYRDFPDGRPGRLYKPLGPSKPKRVPAPPPNTMAATSPLAIASMPVFSYCASSSGVAPSRVTTSAGGSSCPSSGANGFITSLKSSITSGTSSVSNCVNKPNLSFSGTIPFSTKCSRCSCPYPARNSRRSFCRFLACSMLLPAGERT